MKLEKYKQPLHNKVLQEYKENAAFRERYFDYENEQAHYEKRLEELQTRTFKREALRDVIENFMTPFGLSVAQVDHLKELVDEKAVTIIGGQQAGVLTGPLYSVHKAISVILHAREQRERLGVPVIPVFWIAGEDHDLNEINHVYSETNGQLLKEQIVDRFVLKETASEAKYDQQEMVQFVKRIFGKFGETAYTEALLQTVLEAVEEEQTFTNFFVRLMNGLFKEQGLLWIDAADPALRKLESDYFTKLIEYAEPIAERVYEAEQQFLADGFNLPIEAETDAANLFYMHETGRVLLMREGDRFVNESVGLSMTTEELLDITKHEPEKLSNNVVTRPIMQDLVFPVLAFVGGAGELAYWALLREAFHTLDIRMPIFVPRMSVTFVLPKVEKIMQKEVLSFEDVLQGQASNEKIALLEALQDQSFSVEVSSMTAQLRTQYDALTARFAEDNPMLQQLIEKNYTFHEKQLTYLKHKYEDAIYVKHQTQLERFDYVEAQLYPLGQYQERIYHPYVYLNAYGPNLIQDMMNLLFECDGEHYIVYL